MNGDAERELERELGSEMREENGRLWPRSVESRSELAGVEMRASEVSLGRSARGGVSMGVPGADADGIGSSRGGGVEAGVLSKLGGGTLVAVGSTTPLPYTDDSLARNTFVPFALDGRSSCIVS